jgi:hypothetical protein
LVATTRRIEGDHHARPYAHRRAHHEAARLHILEAYIKTQKAENQSPKRQIAAAEKRPARETANAEGAIAEFSAIARRLTARMRAGAPSTP